MQRGCSPRDGVPRAHTRKTQTGTGYSRVLARRRERRTLVAPELREAGPAALDGNTEERHLELHAAVLEHAPPRDLNGARERYACLCPGRRFGRHCGPYDFRNEQEVLRRGGKSVHACMYECVRQARALTS